MPDSEDLVAEGDVYQLRECAIIAVDQFAALDEFLSLVVEEEGRDAVADRLAAIMKRHCANESNQTFRMTTSQLGSCLKELRTNYYGESIESLVRKGFLRPTVGRDGEVYFEPSIDNLGDQR